MNHTSGKVRFITYRQFGFTLIELMIVVIIIGVIAAISYPSYRDYTIRTNRSDGQIALSRLAGDQEKFRSQCNHYAATLPGANRQCGTAAPFADGLLYGGGAGTYFSPDRHYAVTVTAPTAGCPITTCYEMIADPNAAGTTGRQKDNGRLRITSTGLREWNKSGSTWVKWTDK